MLEVGKVTISGQSIDLMILCSSFLGVVCQGRLEPAGTSSGEPTVCTSSQLHLELHQLGSLKSVKARVFTPQKMANATNECPFSESQLFNIYQHVTGDHVSISEIWVQREQEQPCS